ncbi:MAG: peptidase M48, partial [Calditrichaeota bacterium]
HIAHNDLHVMALADMISRTTHMLSLMGQFLLLFNFPLILLGEVTVPWLFIILLIFAPTVSALLQLALSRTREYDADLEAVNLTGDPEGLASALAKMEQLQVSFWERIFLPGRRIPEPSLLRTHPRTEERIRRIMELEKKDIPIQSLIDLSPLPDFRHSSHSEHPRWRITGLWY